LRIDRVSGFSYIKLTTWAAGHKRPVGPAAMGFAETAVTG
jgi:hypothetical protein